MTPRMVDDYHCVERSAALKNYEVLHTDSTKYAVSGISQVLTDLAFLLGQIAQQNFHQNKNEDSQCLVPFPSHKYIPYLYVYVYIYIYLFQPHFF